VSVPETETGRKEHGNFGGCGLSIGRCCVAGDLATRPLFFFNRVIDGSKKSRRRNGQELELDQEVSVSLSLPPLPRCRGSDAAYAYPHLMETRSV
jgi:hypothetical protein